MKLKITAEDLREIVRDGIASSIEVHRASRLSEESYTPPQGEPTDEEVNDFIASNQLLDLDLIENLLDPGLLGFASRVASIRAEDLIEIRENIRDWADTNTWLGADLDFLPFKITQTEVTSSDLWYPSEEHSEPTWLSKTPGALLLAGDLLRQGKLLSEMDWKKFEKLIATLLEKEGWIVELTRGSKDGGIDVIANFNDPIIGKVNSIWQAKKYSPSNKVGLSHVRELSAIQNENRASKAIMVTTSNLTKGALSWIRRDEYRLGYKEKSDVENWVKKYI